MTTENSESNKHPENKKGVEQYLPSEQKGQELSSPPLVEVEDDFSAPEELLQAQALANLLDSAVKIPFIGIKVGLDFLIGLIPVVGDTIMLAASMRIVFLARKMKMPEELQVKILRTALFDYLLGFIPVVGDIVDLFYKANQKNVRTMEMWWVAENKDKIDALAKRQVAQWHADQERS